MYKRPITKAEKANKAKKIRIGETFLLLIACAGVSPNGSQLGVLTYLSFNNLKTTTLINIPISAARKAHLKSAGLPVSPKPPQIIGPIVPLTLIPIYKID